MPMKCFSFNCVPTTAILSIHLIEIENIPHNADKMYYCSFSGVSAVKNNFPLLAHCPIAHISLICLLDIEH